MWFGGRDQNLLGAGVLGNNLLGPLGYSGLGQLAGQQEPNLLGPLGHSVLGQLAGRSRRLTTVRKLPAAALSSWVRLAEILLDFGDRQLTTKLL